MSNETCGLNYEREYTRLQEKIYCMQEENEKKLKENQEIWQQIVDEKNKENSWLKQVINGVLHIS